MNPIKKILARHNQEHEPREFLPILLVIIIICGLLLIAASYLAKTPK